MSLPFSPLIPGTCWNSNMLLWGLFPGGPSFSEPSPRSRCQDKRAVSGCQTPAGPCSLAQGAASCRGSLCFVLRPEVGLPLAHHLQLCPQQDPEGRGRMPTPLPRLSCTRCQTEPRAHRYFPCWSLVFSISPHIFFQDPRFLLAQRTFPDAPLAVSGPVICVEVVVGGNRRNSLPLHRPAGERCRKCSSAALWKKPGRPSW